MKHQEMHNRANPGVLYCVGMPFTGDLRPGGQISTFRTEVDPQNYIFFQFSASAIGQDVRKTGTCILCSSRLKFSAIHLMILVGGHDHFIMSTDLA